MCVRFIRYACRYLGSAFISILCSPSHQTRSRKLQINWYVQIEGITHKNEMKPEGKKIAMKMWIVEQHDRKIEHGINVWCCNNFTHTHMNFPKHFQAVRNAINKILHFCRSAFYFRLIGWHPHTSHNTHIRVDCDTFFLDWLFRGLILFQRNFWINKILREGIYFTFFFWWWKQSRLQ